MLKPTLWRVTYSLLAGICLLLLAAWLSNSTAQICEYNRSTHQYDCPNYNLAFFVLIQGGKAINFYGALITAFATIAIAWFTFTIWKTNESQLIRSEDIERAYMSAGGGPQQGPTGNYQHLSGGRTVPEIGPNGWFQFDINNHGKTKGEILEYGYGWCAPDKLKELPERPQYKWVRYRDQIGPSTQSRGIKRLRIPADRPIIFGRIGYEDIFGKRHSHGFIQNLDKPIAPPYPSYIQTDPIWDVPHVGNCRERNYQEEEPQN